MLRFEDPIYLYLLLIIPVLAIIRFVSYRKQKQKLRLFGDLDLLRQLMPDVSRFRPRVKFWLLQAALALLIVMIARPQMGTSISHEKRKGIETIIAMDISNSMLATDVEPSRLMRSKMMVENLVDNFTDDKLGLIVFAGNAFVQLPITSDYVSAKMFLSSIDPSMIATQGTNIAEAINMAMHSFTQQEGIGKAIIVITDGENHEGGAVEAAQEARKKGVRVYVLGVGSSKGAPIPIEGSGDYLRDNTGNTVLTALNEDMCKQIAQAGGGAYIHVDNNSAAQEQLDNELSKLSKRETSSTIYSAYDEQFMVFGWLALLLLIIEIIISDKKNPLLQHLTLFRRSIRKTLIITGLLLSTVTIASAQSDRQYIRNGNRQFRASQYADAEVAYRKALEKNPRNPQALFNLGDALLAQRKDSLAISLFEQASKLETNKYRKSMAYHNIGVICQRNRLYADAIEAYKASLRLHPSDDETRYNLALCKRLQKNNPQQQKNDKKNDKNKKNNKNKENQKQQNKDEQQKDKQQKQQEPKMSKENADQLLNAAIQEEKATQQRLKKAMQQPKSRRYDKNW